LKSAGASLSTVIIRAGVVPAASSVIMIANLVRAIFYSLDAVIRP